MFFINKASKHNFKTFKTPILFINKCDFTQEWVSNNIMYDQTNTCMIITFQSEMPFIF